MTGKFSLIRKQHRNRSSYNNSSYPNSSCEEIYQYLAMIYAPTIRIFYEVSHLWQAQPPAAVPAQLKELLSAAFQGVTLPALLCSPPRKVLLPSSPAHTEVMLPCMSKLVDFSPHNSVRHCQQLCGPGYLCSSSCVTF